MSHRMASRNVKRPHAILAREHILHVDHNGRWIGADITVSRASALAMGLRRLIMFVDTSCVVGRRSWVSLCRQLELDAALVWQSSDIAKGGYPTQCGYDVSAAPESLALAIAESCVIGYQLAESTRVPVSAQGSGPEKVKASVPRPNMRRPDETPAAIGFASPVDPSKRMRQRRELVALVRSLWHARSVPDVARYIRDALAKRPRTLRTIGKPRVIAPESASIAPTGFDTQRYMVDNRAVLA